MIKIYLMLITSSWMIIAVGHEIADSLEYRIREIERINRNKSIRWKTCKPENVLTVEQLEKLAGSRTNMLDPLNRNIPRKSYQHLNMKLPTSFDSRHAWPNCSSIRLIYDQNTCGSCWAISSTTVMSDRICIAYKQMISVFLSARNLLTCCTYCGDGCNGGVVELAMDYWIMTGICTGSRYGDKDSCLPYPFPACNHGKAHFMHPCSFSHLITPPCFRKCQNGYNISYNDDKYYGESYYRIDPYEKDIMKEIYLNGPVVASFTVYTDLGYYQSGVYEYTNGTFVNLHAIRIIGWGVENNKPYWLCVNSWGEYWGENGLFKILRGVNEFGIENTVIAGTPKIIK